MMIKTITQADEVVDFAWELARCVPRASYPRVEGREELKRNVDRAIRSEREEVIACYHEDVLCGICIYFWDNNQYAQTTQFLIPEHQYEVVAEKLIQHIATKLHGYQLLIGVPKANAMAIRYLQERGFECIESSFDTRLYDLKQPMGLQDACIEEITRATFGEYATFHDKHAVPNEMYYHSANLRKDLPRFRVLAFRQDKQIHGSIFAKISQDGAEVFGLFIDADHKQSGIEGALLHAMLQRLHNELGSVREIVYFIEEDSIDELNAALAAGFQVKDNYRCYRYAL